MFAWSDSIKGAVIGAGITAILSVVLQLLIFAFYSGSYVEKISTNSQQLQYLERDFKQLNTRINLLTILLTRILNSIKIPENEKTAIYNQIQDTIKNIKSEGTFMFASQPEPSYMNELKKLRDSVKPQIIPER
jgi:hypothetical protein